jgi:hypothetical protein
LDSEAGLAALASRDETLAPRVSRVLLLMNDGAERFYRAANRSRVHAAHLLTCRLDIAADARSACSAGPRA